MAKPIRTSVRLPARSALTHAGGGQFADQIIPLGSLCFPSDGEANSNAVRPPARKRSNTRRRRPISGAFPKERIIPLGSLCFQSDGEANSNVGSTTRAQAL